MILSHFSKGLIQLDQNREYPEIDGWHHKPFGFWLSDESDGGWKDWSEGNDFNIEGLAHEIKLIADTSRWIVLSSNKETLEFNEKYKNKIISYINWNQVKKDCAGILIALYSHRQEVRMDLMWYNSWDCSSACVWDLSTIKEFANENP